MRLLDHLGDAFASISAFVRTRWGYRFRNRAALEQHQRQALDRFLAETTRNVPFYAPYRGASLEVLPLLDKATMQKNFSRLNRAGIGIEAAQEIGLRAEQERDFKPKFPGGVTVGLSSGTSGRRGIFLVSERERSIWAGTILARSLSSQALRRLLNPFSPRLRVAFFLRANSNLYTTLHGIRLHFHFCDLLKPLPVLIEELKALQPDLLIAPASVLRQLAIAQLDGDLSIKPIQVISVAEVLEPDDTAYVMGAWGIRTDQLYQCTEGFLGFTCEAGHLHLNEEFVHIEPEWLDARRERFVPIITDFTRRAQTFIRYRLDDVLRLNPSPCPCGRVTRRLVEIEGRKDDVLWLPPDESTSNATSSLRAIFPDLLRRAFLVSHGQLSDYRLEQHDMVWQVQLAFDVHDSTIEGRVRDELALICRNARGRLPVVRFDPWKTSDQAQKRRRIRCVVPPQVLESSL